MLHLFFSQVICTGFAAGIFLSCAPAAETKAPTKIEACDVLLAHHEMYELERLKIVSNAQKHNQAYLDSLDQAYKNAQEKSKTLLETYKTENKLSDDKAAYEKMQSTCHESFQFGKNVLPERKDTVMHFLYEKFINAEYGGTRFTPAEPENYNINDRLTADKAFVKPDVGSEYIAVEEYPEWKKKRIAKWQAWKNEVNPIIKEYTGKTMEELSVLELEYLKETVTEYWMKRKVERRR